MPLTRFAGLGIAVCAVLPLLALEAWSGFRLATADSVLGVLAATEQPLSVRSPGGVWAMALALGWFALSYWSRKTSLWEAGLVLIGGTAALLRLGNAWLFALALVLPLAHQLALARLKPLGLALIAATSLGVTALTLVTIRPPALPGPAAAAVAALGEQGNVLTDWRWAAALHAQLGPTRPVLAAGGLTSEPPDFWLDYLRIAQGHQLWSAALRQRDVNLVVLEAVDQQRATAVLIRTSSDWRVVFDADGALVAQRVGP